MSPLSVGRKLLGLNSAGTREILPGNRELLRQYRWRVEIDSPFPFPPELVASVNFPFPGFEIDTRHRGTRNLDFASFLEVGSINITFYDDENLVILNSINQWKSSIRNRDHTYNYPASYKKSIKCNFLNSYLETIYEFKLLGVWPSGTSEFSLDYSSSDFIRIPQNFTFDDYVITKTQRDSGN